MIEPDTEVCDYVIGYDGSRYVSGFPEDVFTSRIFWWRSEEDTEKWISVNRAISSKSKFPLVEGQKGNEYVGDFHG